MMNRTKMRANAFKLIYINEIQNTDNIDEQIDIYLTENNIANNDGIEYIKDVIYGVQKNKEEIIEIIKSCIDSKWTIDRISKINLSLLKLAIYEIKYKDIPYKVEIDEVVELAKKYGEDESSIFINGVLASVIKKLKLV